MDVLLFGFVSCSLLIGLNTILARRPRKWWTLLSASRGAGDMRGLPASDGNLGQPVNVMSTSLHA